MANQRQLAAAALAYANANRGILPFTSWSAAPVDNWCYDQSYTGIESDRKKGQLWPYLSSGNAYRCPLDSGQWSNGVYNNLSSYVMNGAMSGFAENNYIGLNVYQFKAKSVMFYEIPATILSVNGNNDGTNVPPEGMCNRHFGATAAAYIDGHAELIYYKTFVSECLKGPSSLWCDPTATDGGASKWTIPILNIPQGP